MKSGADIYNLSIEIICKLAYTYFGCHCCFLSKEFHKSGLHCQVRKCSLLFVQFLSFPGRVRHWMRSDENLVKGSTWTAENGTNLPANVG